MLDLPCPISDRSFNGSCNKISFASSFLIIPIVRHSDNLYAYKEAAGTASERPLARIKHNELRISIRIFSMKMIKKDIDIYIYLYNKILPL